MYIGVVRSALLFLTEYFDHKLPEYKAVEWSKSNTILN